MKIVAHGDSWFDYPEVLGTGGSVIDHLSRLLNQPIVNLAHHGDGSEVSMSLPKRKALEENIVGADFLLVSSGGDDIAGDQFCIWLNENTGDVKNAVNWGRFFSAISLIVADYEDLAEIRDRLAPNCVIVTHGYDFPTSRQLGEGVCTLGPWLKPSLDYCGYTSPIDQIQIITEVLKAFNDTIGRMYLGKGKHIHVSTQGTLTPDDWSNEIHPNRAGFEKIALKFKEAILNNAT